MEDSALIPWVCAIGVLNDTGKERSFKQKDTGKQEQNLKIISHSGTKNINNISCSGVIDPSLKQNHVSYRIISYHITSIILYRTVPYYILSYRPISYHIILYHIVLYGIGNKDHI